MKPITARYAGSCKACGNRFPVGTVIIWDQKLGSYHSGTGCEDIAWSDLVGAEEAIAEAAAYAAEHEAEKRLMAREDAEYAAGVADAERYMQDRRMVGEALADEWERDHEMMLYNTGQVD